MVQTRRHKKRLLQVLHRRFEIMPFSLYSAISLLALSNLRAFCYGQRERETIDLCSNISGTIQYEGKSYKTWHFLPKGCTINGTLTFTYRGISNYFWRTYSKFRFTSNSIRITDIPTPLWDYDDRYQPRTVRVSNSYAAVMTYDAEYASSEYSPQIRIKYEFRNEEVSTTTSYYESTSLELRTTTPDATEGFVTTNATTKSKSKNRADGANSSTQLVIHRRLTFVFGISLLVTSIILIAALLRVRHLDNQLKKGAKTSNGNSQLSVTVQRTGTDLHEIKVNELYSSL